MININDGSAADSGDALKINNIGGSTGGETGMLKLLKQILPKNNRSKGVLAALAGAFLISFDPVFIQLAGIKGFDTVFLFGLFSAISMATVIQVTDKRGLPGTLKESGWPAVVSGLLIVGSATTFVFSVKQTAVANTMIILTGRPILTALFSWIFLREKVSKALLMAIIGLVIGISVVVSGSLESGKLLGDGLAFVSVIFLGLNGALLRRYKNVSRLAIVGLGGVFLALVMFIPADPSSYSPRTWLVMAASSRPPSPGYSTPLRHATFLLPSRPSSP